MRPILVALALVALALVLYSALPPRDDAYDPVRYAQQQADLDRIARAEARAAALEPLDRVLAVAWRLVALAAVLGGLWWLFERARISNEVQRTRAAYVDPDAAGRLPLRLDDREAALSALAAYHRTEHARANVGPVPVTYSPNITLHNATAPLVAPAPAPALVPGDVSSPAPVPTFARLLADGRIGRGADGKLQPILLGLDRATGAELPGSWLDLYSCGVGGLAGSGKTSTALFLLAQAALHGARFVLLDPHAGNAESLAARLAPLSGAYLCAPAESPREMADALDLVRSELSPRLVTGSPYVRGSKPIVLVADEFAALQRSDIAESLNKLVESLGQEGRKVDVFALLCSQVWTAARAGGSELRDSLASAYIHRLRPAQARMLSGLTADELPGDLLALPSGSAYLLSTRGELRAVNVPLVAPSDMHQVAALLSGPPSGPPSGPRPGHRIGFRPGPGPDAAPIRPGSGPDGASASERDKPALDAESVRLLSLFASGASIHDLATELAGTANPSDRRYKAARAKVESLLRQIAGGNL